MVFNDYCTKLKQLLKNKRYDTNIVDHNLNKIFDNYVNSTPITECAKSLIKSTLNESVTGKNDYKKYAKRVLTILETMGYQKDDISKNITNRIADSYDIEENEYACAELCKNDIEKENKFKPIKLTKEKIEKIKNNLIINMHNVNNAALLDLNVSPTAATIKIKVRLFQNLTNIETDVKSYIKVVHKYLSAFVAQNANVDVENKIKSYAIKFNNLYCTIEFNIPFINADGTSTEKFNMYDISRIIQSYMNVLGTFTEQYKNVIRY